MKEEAARTTSPPRTGGVSRQRRTSDGSASPGVSNGNNTPHPRTPTAPRAMPPLREEEGRRPAPMPPVKARKPDNHDEGTSHTFLTALAPTEQLRPSRMRARELRPPSPLGALGPSFEADYIGAMNGSADPPSTTNYVGSEAIQKFWRIFHRQDVVNNNKAILASPPRPGSPSSSEAAYHQHRPADHPAGRSNSIAVVGLDRPRSARTTYLSAVRSMRLCAEPLGIVRR